MDEARISVVARAKAKPGMEDRLAEEAGALVAPTRQEDGCVNYDLHRSAENPAEILFYENWESQEHLDRHLQSAHVKAVLDLLPELTEDGIDVKVYKMLSSPAIH